MEYSMSNYMSTTKYMSTFHNSSHIFMSTATHIIIMY